MILERMPGIGEQQLGGNTTQESKSDFCKELELSRRSLLCFTTSREKVADQVFLTLGMLETLIVTALSTPSWTGVVIGCNAAVALLLARHVATGIAPMGSGSMDGS